MSEENIGNITKPDLTKLNFNGYCLINNNISIREKVINLYISYILNPWILNLNFLLNNSLFGSAELNKKVDRDKYQYRSCEIAFDSCSEFSLTNGNLGKHIIIFRTDLSLSLYIDNKNKDILILGEGPTQVLDDTTLKAEVKYLINFTEQGKRFVLGLHYNGSNSFFIC